MKKKGFTLVELLAVIAILAILVIIALPNILGLFNDAKKNSFVNEVKEIYKAAQTQWVSDSLVAGGERTYKRVGGTVCTGSNYGTLKLDGRTDINYEIQLNSQGEVTSLTVYDDTYQFVSTSLTVDSIKSDSTSFGVRTDLASPVTLDGCSAS